jgi:hypothetical protein
VPIQFAFLKMIKAHQFVDNYIVYEKYKKFLPKGQKSTAPTDSHMLSHCSTNAALPSLTLEIGRDPVLSRRYGRTCKSMNFCLYKGLN